MNKRIASTRDEHPLSSSGAALYQAAVSSTARWLLVGFVAGAFLVPAEPARAQDMKPKIEEKVKRAAVMVFTAESKRKKADTPLGTGSGYFINSTGLMITNNHVVDPVHGRSPREKHMWHFKHGRLAWEIITDSGTEDEKKWDAMVLYQNESADQAVLQVYDEDSEKLSTPNYLRFQRESRLKKRMKVWALGFPGGDSQKRASDKKHPEMSVTVGHVIDVPRTPAGRIRRVYTDVVARPGNSGGAMVDVDGFLVGTVTLMTPPKGREDTGGANYSALVPTKLTTDMIRNAFDLGKIEAGTDVTPFMEMLTQEDGRLDIPEFARLRERDVLFFEDGDRIHGDIATNAITWKSPLGELSVPTSAIAYVMNNEEGSHLFLEGGNRISTPEVDSSFEFTPDGGAKTTLRFDAFQTVGFRTSDRQLEPATGKIVVLDSELTHLRLADVQGSVKLEGKLSPIDVKLEEIERIDTNDSDQQVVLMRDGRRMTGKFGEGTYKATIADTGTPIEFGLSEVKEARVDIVRYQPDRVAGLGLLGVLADADRDVRRIAETLDDGDVAGARTEVEKILSSKEFRKLPATKKDQFRLVAAVAVLRDGDGKQAAKDFRKCLRSEDLNISAFAKACSAVLKRFDDFTYQGKPLADRAVFVEAGFVIADEYIQKVRDFLKDAKAFEGKKRSEYIRSTGAAKKNEDAMRIAAVFRGSEADDELIRLWKLAFVACQRELARIDEEVKEKQAQARSGGRGAGKRRQREIDELNGLRKQVIETGETYLMKLYEYGFRIEDPDIQEHKEREDDEEPGDEPDDEREPDDDEGP